MIIEKCKYTFVHHSIQMQIFFLFNYLWPLMQNNSLVILYNSNQLELETSLWLAMLEMSLH